MKGCVGVPIIWVNTGGQQLKSSSTGPVAPFATQCWARKAWSHVAQLTKWTVHLSGMDHDVVSGPSTVPTLPVSNAMVPRKKRARSRRNSKMRCENDPRRFPCRGRDKAVLPWRILNPA